MPVVSLHFGESGMDANLVLNVGLLIMGLCLFMEVGGRQFGNY